MGAIVLMALVLLVFIVPELMPLPEKRLDPEIIALFEKQSKELKKVFPDSSDNNWSIHTIENVSLQTVLTTEPGEKSKLFYFDPNTISGDGWRKLGLRERTVETIQKFIAKGGRFKKPEDLAKIYGLSKAQYQQLVPFVRIISSANMHASPKVFENKTAHLVNSREAVTILDINKADTTELIALPGIGSKLANRLVNFRARLGGFYSVDQVKELYGMPDSTFQKIKQYLVCDSTMLGRININTANAESMKNHPYLKWNIANAIVNYRLQHGRYASPEDLLKIDIVTSDLLERLRPYLELRE